MILHHEATKMAFRYGYIRRFRDFDASNLRMSKIMFEIPLEASGKKGEGNKETPRLQSRKEKKHLGFKMTG